MRFLMLPDMWTLLVCFLVWPIYMVAAAVVCLKIDDRHFATDKGVCKTMGWEREGRIYKTIFRINKWKKWLPDGGAVMKNGFSKRHVDVTDPAAAEKFLIESRRAEISHWLAILPFWTFGFITPPAVIWLMLAFALAVNLPCIMAQRYNRPRIMRITAGSVQRRRAVGRGFVEPDALEDRLSH